MPYGNQDANTYTGLIVHLDSKAEKHKHYAWRALSLDNLSNQAWYLSYAGHESMEGLQQGYGANTGKATP